MFHRNQFKKLMAGLLVAATFVLATATFAAACPFCNVESRTLTEEINASEAVVLAKRYASEDAARLVNGILARVAREETAAKAEEAV